MHGRLHCCCNTPSCSVNGVADPQNCVSSWHQRALLCVIGACVLVRVSQLQNCRRISVAVKTTIFHQEERKIRDHSTQSGRPNVHRLGHTRTSKVSGMPLCYVPLASADGDSTRLLVTSPCSSGKAEPHTRCELTRHTSAENRFFASARINCLPCDR